MSTGKYDDQEPEWRAQLEKAESTVSYLSGKSTLTLQEGFEFMSSRVLLLEFETKKLIRQMEQLQQKVLMQQKVLELRAARAQQPHAGDTPPTTQ
jgi:hypothetical protein